METEAKKHTTHEQTLTKKRTQSLSATHAAMGKTENSTQVKSKAQTKQLTLQLRQLSTQVVEILMTIKLCGQHKY